MSKIGLSSSVKMMSRVGTSSTKEYRIIWSTCSWTTSGNQHLLRICSPHSNSLTLKVRDVSGTTWSRSCLRRQASPWNRQMFKFSRSSVSMRLVSTLSMKNMSRKSLRKMNVACRWWYKNPRWCYKTKNTKRCWKRNTSDRSTGRVRFWLMEGVWLQNFSINHRLSFDVLNYETNVYYKY